MTSNETYDINTSNIGDYDCSDDGGDDDQWGGGGGGGGDNCP